MVRNPKEDNKAQLEEVMQKRTNAFNSFKTQQLQTQWKHKISVIPESEGITGRWWEFTSEVSRSGPEAEIPVGETIRTKQSGEYIVGIPALAGGAARVEGTAQSGGNDDYWIGYTDRIDAPDADDNGAGIGYSYFDQGEGDNGGADQAGDQEYVWFRSGVSGVSDLRVPRDQWNGENINDVAPAKGDFIKKGGFLRIDHTFYNQGSVDVNWAFKTDDGGLDVRTIHRFNVENNPMWTQSDLHIEAGTEGTNLTGYLNAAHYKAGIKDQIIRENGIGRDGTVYGADVTVNEGEPRPLISIQLRSGWENVNIQPVGLNVNMDGDFYVFISVGSDLANADFQPPNSEIAGINPDGTEYAANADNSATDFNSIGEIEFFSYVSAQGGGPFNIRPASASISQTIPDFSLSNGEIATLGIIPVGASTLNGAGLRWGANF